MSSDAAGEIPERIVLALDPEQQLRAQLGAVEHLRSRRRQLELAQVDVAAAVSAARASGVSWARIGLAMGLTAEGARRRWFEPDEISDLL